MMKKKWLGKVGLVLFLCCVGVVLGNKNEVFAVVEWGTESNNTNVPGCDAPSCYNGAAWVHYTIKDGETRGRVGDVPPELNLQSAKGVYKEGKIIPEGGKSCDGKGNGFWVLQQVTSKWRGYERYYAFGIHQAKDVGGGSISYVTHNLNGVLDDTYTVYDISGAYEISSGSRATYDEDKLEPDGFILTESEIEELYMGWKESSDPDWTGFKSGGGSWFCGDNGIPTGPETATFNGGISLEDGTGGYFSCNAGMTKCTGPGTRAVANPVSGKPTIKRTNDTPEEATSRYKLVFGTTVPTLNDSSPLTPALKKNQKHVGGTVASSKTIDVKPGWQEICFTLAFDNKVDYSGGGTVTGRSSTSKRKCIKFKNYASFDVALTGNSTASLADHSSNPALIKQDGQNGVLDDEYLDPATNTYKNYFDDPSIPADDKKYIYTFQHKIKVNNDIYAKLEKYNGDNTIIVNYAIKQSVNGGAYTDVSGTSSPRTFTSSDGTDYKHVAPSPITSKIDLSGLTGSDSGIYTVCQKMEYTSKLQFVAGNSGLTRTVTDTAETGPVCVTITKFKSEDVEEDGPEGKIEVKGDTDESNIGSDLFSDGGFYHDNRWKMSDIEMKGKFVHKMWLEVDADSYTEGATPQLNGHDRNFVRDGDPGSVLDEKFKSSYVGAASLSTGADLLVKPNGGATTGVFSGVNSYGLEFSIVDSVLSKKYKVTNLQPGGPSGGNYSTDNAAPNLWTSQSGASGGNSDLTVGRGTDNVNGIIGLLAGEDGTLDVKTKNKPTTWTTKYKDVYHVRYLNGVEKGRDYYKTIYKHDELEEDVASENTSEHVTNVPVHRDYNFKIGGFDALNLETTSMGGGFVTAGEEVAIEYDFSIARHSYDFTAAKANPTYTDDGNWNEPGDTNKREFVTDVFQNNTNAYLVYFEIAPENNLKAKIDPVLDGAENYKYDGGDEHLPATYSDDGFKSWLEKEKGLSVSYVEHKGANDVLANYKGKGVYGSNGFDAQGNEISGYIRKKSTFNKKFDIPLNAAVGTKICAGIFIENPTNGANGLDEANGSSLLSEIVCANVVKKPMFEVWGGDVAADGGIKTSLTTYQDKIFGSWGDFGLIAANKEIETMSSGRGIKGDVAKGGVAKGTAKEEYSKMTIANKGSLGKAGIVGLNGTDVFDGLSNRYSGSTGRTDIVVKTGVSGAIGANVPSDEISKTHIIFGNNIVIDHDITIKNDGYTNIGDIVQVIIVSDGIITIKDTVQHVDAWLIAKGAVDTCSAGSDTIPYIGKNSMAYDDAENNRVVSLTNCKERVDINGPVIGSKVAMERTYGNNPNNKVFYSGAASATEEVPGVGNTLGASAEKIDYNPGAIIFGVKESGDGIPRTTYIRKLAPRY